jgi:lipopolysaccharide assembly protein B
LIATVGEQWIAVLLILAFLFGIFIGFRLRLFRRGAAGEKDARQSAHYIRGMYAMLTSDVEVAIEELSKVVELSTEPIEVYLALGNLYRQRGQIDRAIAVHRSLLTRRSLSEEERVLALNALGQDFRTGGLIDRALKTFREALALAPRDRDALLHLVKLSEDLGEWGEAYDFAVRLQKVQRPKDPRHLSYLLAKKAETLAEGGMHVRASWFLHRAIRLHPENTPAYVFLAQLYLKVGKAEKARRIIEKTLRRMPHKCYAVLPLLKEITLQLQDMEGYLRTLHDLAHEHHQKRAMLQELQEFLEMKRTEQALAIVDELVRHFGRSRLVQKTLWDLVRKGFLPREKELELAALLSKSEQMMDPFTCIFCSYKTLEVLFRCPNCKEWNSFADTEG